MRYKLAQFRARREDMPQFRGLAAEIAQNLQARLLDLKEDCPPVRLAEPISSAGYPKGSQALLPLPLFSQFRPLQVCCNVVQTAEDPVS